MFKGKLFEKYPIAELMLGIGALCLFVTRLDNIYLWQDEAQRALIAKTILHGGLPRGFDGLNYFSQELGRDYGAGYLWRWHPWLPFYVLALFFSFHISTFMARLPFVLFGLATVALTYCFVRSIWGERRPALLAAGFLSTSVPFLLLSRQCNYYSMTAFFSLLSLHGYMKITEGRKHAAALTAVSLFMLFHTQYIYCVPCGAAMLGHALIYRQDLMKKLCLLFAAVLVINIPGILWYGGTSFGGNSDLTHTSATFIQFVTAYGQQIFTYIFPSIFFVALVALWIISYYRKESFLSVDQAISGIIVLLVIFILTSLLMLSAVSPAPFFRYLVPLLPLGAILVALIAEAVFRRQLVFGLMVVTLWFCCHPLKDYLYELTHDYHGPIGGIVEFLKANARPTDVVAITYGDLPVKFYTGLRVVGGLTGEDLAPVVDANWIILRRNVVSDKDAHVREYIVQHVNPQLYQPIQLDVPDLPFENRESPQEHLFRTAQDASPVLMFKRVRP